MDGDSFITWCRIFGRYSNDTVLAKKLFAELFKKYASLNRYYHNFDHIKSLLGFYDQYGGMLQNREAVGFSIFYHDFVYNIFRRDNEHRSAIVAEKKLRMAGLPEAEIATVKLFIEATQAHQVPVDYQHTSDLALFLDFDMAILGAAPEEYRQYTKLLRKEYGLIPRPLFRAGRKKFLESCLQSEFIFHTPVFRDKYEAAARR